MKIKSIIRKISFINNYNNYPDGVIVIDSLNNISKWNKKACEIFGYAEKEITGRNIALIFDAEVEKVKEAAENARAYVISAKNNCGEDIFVEISCKNISANQKTLITVREVTNNQKVIEKLLFEYERAIKISTFKNNFIAGLSNDLKTPIHSIVGFSQGMLDGICGELNEKQLKYITIMNKNANSLLNVVNDFLELSRLEREGFELETKVFDLIKVINQVCEIVKNRAENKGLNFDVDLSGLARKNIYSNEEFLTKVIFNIVENAVKFTETGAVRVKVSHPDIEFVKTYGVKVPEDCSENAYLLFNVTDTGIGIAKDETSVIFDEYSQVERNIAKKYGGTGLKLAASRKIIALLGGVIWVESELAQGSSFSFIIPIEKFAVAEKQEALQSV